MTTVIAIQMDSSGHGLAARLAMGSPYPGAMDPVSLQLPDPMPSFGSAADARHYGRTVATALARHRAISAELQRLAYLPPSAGESLQFRIETPSAERLRWETILTDAQTFLAVDPGCRISRQAASAYWTAMGPRVYEMPLRLTAFVSAIGAPARSELNELVGAVRSARASKLDLRAHIYIGEESELERLRSEDPDGVKLSPLPSTADQLKVELKNEPPQFLHFYCHGVVSAGVPVLEMATANDWDLHDAGDEPRGSVRLAIDQLVDVLAVQRTTWTTVLNSCSGAKAVEQLNSMAFQIAERGSPVAVGMHEEIPPADAPHFSRVFYREAFAIVNETLASPNGKGLVALDLTPAITPVRRMFHELYLDKPPDAFGRWALPVLFEHPEPLRIAPALDELMRQRIDLIAGFLRQLGAETADAERDRALRLLDLPPNVPQRYRPDRFGQLPQSGG